MAARKIEEPHGDESDSGERPVATASVRGGTLAACRDATRDLFGADGLAAVHDALRDGPCREALERRLPDWVPDAWAIAWCEAAWSGPIARDHEALGRWVRRMIDRGFGLRQRLLLSIATPSGVVRRAHDLWRSEQSHGRVVPVAAAPTGLGHDAVLTLHEHAYTEHPVTRDVVAESFRNILERAGAADCVEEHERDAAPTLGVRLRWR